MLRQEHKDSSSAKRLQDLRDLLAEMANHIELSLADAVMGLIEHRSDFTRKAVSEQARIETLHDKADALAIELLGGGHLSKRGIRFTAHALKIAMDLERMEEEVRQVADSTMVLNVNNARVASKYFPKLVENTQGIVADGIDAFINCNNEQAEALLQRARNLDVTVNEIFHEILTHIAAHPGDAGTGMHMLLMTRSFRRIGDAAANMARSVKYICLRHIREQEKKD